MASAALDVLKEKHVEATAGLFLSLFLPSFPLLFLFLFLSFFFKGKTERARHTISADSPIISAYLFTPYSDPTTSGCIATHVTT